MARQSARPLAVGKHLQLIEDRGWEYADRAQGTGVVAIIAMTDDGELVLTEQYRRPVNKKVVDLAAGLVGDIEGEEEESLEVAAKRELLEETGFAAGTMEYLFTAPSSPGMTTEMVAFFLATKLKRQHAGGGDESESIKVHTVPLQKISRWLTKKQTKRTCVDTKVFAALGMLSLQRESN